MAEQENAATPGSDGQSDAGEASSTTYAPPATQADLDRIIAERVSRTKNQFKDYNDLKAKAEKFDQAQQASQSDLERATAEATRWQSEADKWRTATVSTTITALASNDFADPSDAASALPDPGKYLDMAGQIDEAAIRADLAEVLERKPHWRRSQDGPSTPRAPAPNPAQGSGGGRPVVNPAQEFAMLLQGQLGT